MCSTARIPFRSVSIVNARKITQKDCLSTLSAQQVSKDVLSLPQSTVINHISRMDQKKFKKTMSFCTKMYVWKCNVWLRCKSRKKVYASIIDDRYDNKRFSQTIKIKYCEKNLCLMLGFFLFHKPPVYVTAEW